MISSSEIRRQFIDFFCKKHGHQFVPSSSVVPQGDPTLMFSNAGMNQFKDVFLGTGTRPYKRAANTQKCIRAGGKHNDLDDVGKDTYHHTFFEMLGNWSFGDYFKKEAIQWAWELLTQVWKLDKSRLHATVFEGGDGLQPDDEAAELWRTVTDIDHSHIHWGNKKDNFWEMGDTGPCGPCTEIHIDKTPDKTGGKLVNKGTQDAIEIWNLVFIQFNRNADKTLTPLPAKHVDTGMGFERVTAVIQGKASNYDTDVFTPIFDAICSVTGATPYTGSLKSLNDIAYRVIADHIRTLVFALADGGVFSNDGRGFVLRRIVRRAERFAWQYFNTRKPFLTDLVATVVATMGDAFPELSRNPQRIANVIRDEEDGFLRTLGRGMRIIEDRLGIVRTSGTGEWTATSDTPISGKDAFYLHDTEGIYIDILEQIAQEAGQTVDRHGYEVLMAEAKRKAREARKKTVITAVQGDLPATDDSARYTSQELTAVIQGWVKDSIVNRKGQLSEYDEGVGLLLNQTCFYAESGGQVGDSGTIRTPTGVFEVEDTQRLGDAVLHVGRMTEGFIEVEQEGIATIGPERLPTMRNHTTTHLLNWALREVLGDDVEQKGSLVDAEKTRFDFTHSRALTPDEIADVERLVNEKIYADLPVTPWLIPLTEAKKIHGVRAVFGEKYPDPVRVLLIGPDSPETATRADPVEFCGGTHLTHTGQAGFFKIVSQEGVAKGVRRITGVTGRGAVQAVQKLAGVVDGLSSRLSCKPDELTARIEVMQEELKKLQTQVKKGAAGDLNSAGDQLLASALEVGGAKIVVGEVPAAGIDQMRMQLDRLRQKAGSCVVLVGWVDEDKVGLLSGVTHDLTSKIQAGKLVGEVAKLVGGKGGGRPDMAQAGGSDVAKLGEALAAARKMIREKLT